MGLETLRSVLQSADASTSNPGEMPLDELRFVVEFATPPNLQQIRAQLIAILQSQAFLLEPLFTNAAAPLDRFLLLRIVGVERTLPADVLFEAAYALAAELGAVSVEPDVGSRFFEEAAPPAEGPRGEAAAAVRRWCNVNVAPPADQQWALHKVQAPAAWQADPKQGAEVIVAQPDTGVIPTHLELTGALDMERAFNILKPGEPPLDPLASGMANPGHGTAVASCVASRGEGGVTGSAPRARVAPIRCINDVKVFDAAPVARAIEHARAAGCHVISMSLGGVPSRALHAALKEAVDAELIVLAAAGNCVRFVVWPARYEECIAVAGVNVDDAPWKGSCRGKAVDISAPAENVWKADARNNSNDGVTAGQGTSFAVAIAAGVAALWLAHHGRDKLIGEARARGVKLQHLFRSALAQTARRPTEWDASSFGPGVIDAAAVQALDPKKIRIVKKEGAAVTATPNEIADLVAELGDGAADLPPEFDWRRYGLELANVMMERARRERRARSGASTEAGRQSYRPSRTLVDALERARSPALEAVRKSRVDAFSPTPRIIPTRDTGNADAATALRILGSAVRKDQREAAARITPEKAQAELTTSGGQLVDNTLAELAHVREGAGSAAQAAGALHDFLSQYGRDAVTALAKTGTTKALSGRQRVSTEALIKLTGRPALRVKDDGVNFKDPQIGAWHAPLLLIEDEIPRLVKAVGRIDVDGAHVGTGFLVADDLVMTNRHVLEEIAAPVPTGVQPKSWVLAQQGVTIDFRREQGSVQSLRFAVTEVVFSGPTPINDTEYVDFADLDMAVLRIEKVNGEGQKLPPPLSFLQGDLKSHLSQDVLVIGYPARPSDLPVDDEGDVRKDVVDALARLFGLRYGVKYLSPGSVTSQPGTLQGDGEKWVFGHDCTTLGGNSGSCVIRYGPKPAIIGLHFAGEFERANYAHGVRRVVDGNHVPAALVKRFTWVEE